MFIKLDFIRALRGSNRGLRKRNLFPPLYHLNKCWNTKQSLPKHTFLNILEDIFIPEPNMSNFVIRRKVRKKLNLIYNIRSIQFNLFISKMKFDLYITAYETFTY